ncbi:MAG TPA: hypothetical protein VFP61_10930 [Acidimicrobiales bacterium]|nr:hypothetical protein [Acidimicrobiales bacterium]
MTTRRTKLTGAAVAVAGLALTAAPAAHADTPAKTAWYYAPPPSGTALPAAAPAAPPAADPTNSLVVGGGQGTTTEFAALDYRVAPGTPGATLTLTVASNNGAPGAAGTPLVDACAIAQNTWTAGGGQAGSAAPAYDCSAAVKGTTSSDGTTVTFALPAPSGTDVDLAIVPDPTAQPFTVSFAQPDSGAFTPAAAPSSSDASQGSGYSAPATSTSGATAPDTSSGASGSSAAGAGGSFSSSSVGGSGSADSSGSFSSSSPSASSSLAAGAASPSFDAGGATPSVNPLPTAAGSTATSPSGAGSSAATPAQAATATPASVAHPVGGGSKWLIGAVGLGLLVVGLLYGATRQTRAPKLLGSLSIAGVRGDTPAG